MCKLEIVVISALLCLALAQGAAVDSSNADLVVEKEKDTLPVNLDVDVPEDCRQPKETGRCFALFYRHAYSVDTHSCEEFIYGGCAGNKNNFESKELCESTCLHGSADQTTEAVTELAVESSTPIAL